MASDAGTYGEQFGKKFQRHLLAVACRKLEFVLGYRTVLSYEFFSSDIDRAIARALLEHTDKYQKLPLQPTLIEEVRQIVSEEDMEDTETAIGAVFDDDLSDYEAVADLAIEFGKQQAMCNAVMAWAEKIDKGERDEVLPLIQDASLVGENILDMGTEYTSSSDRLDWYTEDEHSDVIPTGIKHLDYSLGGGLGRGELGIVLGPPKRGKSTTLINFAFGALTRIRDNATSAGGFNVVYYTFEMKLKKIARRFDDRVAAKVKVKSPGGTDMQLIELKHSNPEQYTEILSERIDKLVQGKLILREYPTRTCTPTMIRSHLRLLAGQGFEPDLVIVDYADIAKAERRKGEMRHEQAGIYEDLRQIAGEFNVALWTGSQGNRDSHEADVVDMTNFAEAFEKAAIMDAGISFCQSPEEKLRGHCRLFLCGLRDQEDGRTVFCDINRKTCFIKSIHLLDSTYAEVLTPYDGDSDKNMTNDERTSKAQAMKSISDLQTRAAQKAKGNWKNRPVRKKKPTKTVPVAATKTPSKGPRKGPGHSGKPPTKGPRKG